MSQTAGVLSVAVAVLWIAYLVPHRLRYRQQLAESRTDDRFSERLRVVRVAGKALGARPARQAAAPQGRVLLHPPRRGGGSVDRPHRLADRAVADAVRRTAAERAARAAYLARRRAAARRRAVLAATLLVLSVAGWAGVAAGAALALAAVPTLLLATVLVLGRRAVVAGRRVDAAWAAGARARAAVPRSTRPVTAVGHARRPSDASTEIIARVPAERTERTERAGTTERTATTERTERTERVGVEASEAERRRRRAELEAAGRAELEAQREEAERRAEEEAARRAERAAARAAKESGPAWAPVPVPRPTYSLKPAVRRPEPAPLVLDEQETAPAAGTVAEQTAHESDAQSAQVDAAVQEAADAPAVAARFDLDAVLARRRAAGE